jgi:hypothetical protein
MYFTKGKLYTFECEMVTKPNFQKRGSGFRIMSLNHRKTKKIIVNPYSSYEEMLFRMLKEIRYFALTERVNQVMHKNKISESIFKDDNHRMRFANLLKAGELQEIRSSPAFVSAMFLLTADPFVWYRTGRCTNDGVIYFYDSLWGANPSNQILYQTAKDLYLGAMHISLDDLCSSTVISDQLLSLLMTAFLLRRYGISILENKIWGDYFYKRRKLKTRYQ